MGEALTKLPATVPMLRMGVLLTSFRYCGRPGSSWRMKSDSSSWLAVVAAPSTTRPPASERTPRRPLWSKSRRTGCSRKVSSCCTSKSVPPPKSEWVNG
jgi:hypothetical protein